jgi:trehalose 6-phosphate phosphatase
MSYLFARERSGVLAQLAWARLLLAFDHDGTLAPAGVEGEEATMRPRTARLLERVAARYPTAVVVERVTGELASSLRRLGVRHLLAATPPDGVDATADAEAELGQALVLLEQQLADHRGIELEDRGTSLAIHYRRARSKPAARAAIEEAVAALPMAVKTVPGKQVVHVVAAAAPRKADAIVRLREAEGADTVLYVGDDVTDEDVFALDQPGRLVAVRVTRSLTSAATYHLRDQSEIDRLLSELAALRAAHAEDP